MDINTCQDKILMKKTVLINSSILTIGETWATFYYYILRIFRRFFIRFILSNSFLENYSVPRKPFSLTGLTKVWGHMQISGKPSSTTGLMRRWSTKGNFTVRIMYSALTLRGKSMENFQQENLTIRGVKIFLQNDSCTKLQFILFNVMNALSISVDAVFFLYSAMETTSEVFYRVAWNIEAIHFKSQKRFQWESCIS